MQLRPPLKLDTYMATYVHVGKYSFEIEDLLAYTFVCNTKEAITCVKNKTCCCNIFIIDTTQAKISRIISIFDTIAEFCPNIKNDNEYVNPFEREQANEYFIEFIEGTGAARGRGREIAIRYITPDMNSPADFAAYIKIKALR